MINKKQLFVFVLLLVFLPISLLVFRLGVKLWPQAAPILANIEIDANGVLGSMPESWRALAQGGEDEGRSHLSTTKQLISSLDPRHIRIDHIYDAYDLVAKDENGAITYNWVFLDKTVDDILAMGALPFFALSYMPPSMARDGNPINEPIFWHEWEGLVQATIEHYSGKNGKNLSGVYYEVWNEPDLFGDWHMGCSRLKIGCQPAKNYRNLYYHSAVGAAKASNVNSFKIGGPATTGLYTAWIGSLLQFCQQENLRIDFLSWHRYTQSPQVFEKDMRTIEAYLGKYPQFATLEKLITEWGSDSENSSLHDGTYDAAHTIAIVRRFLTRLDWGFSFEIKDGKSPENKAFWGRWGLLTHEDFGTRPKPRYYAFDWLNRLKGQRLSVAGEGSHISAIASKDGNKVFVLMVNFDPRGQHYENVPVTITNLNPGSKYRLETTRFSGTSLQVEEISASSTGSIGRMIPMPTQSIIFLTFLPV